MRKGQILKLKQTTPITQPNSYLLKLTQLSLSMQEGLAYLLLDFFYSPKGIRHNIRIKYPKISINIERYVNSPLLNSFDSENLILYDLHGLLCQPYAFFISFFHKGHNWTPAFPGHCSR
jgi:hypothetical protein